MQAYILTAVHTRRGVGHDLVSKLSVLGDVYVLQIVLQESISIVRGICCSLSMMCDLQKEGKFGENRTTCYSVSIHPRLPSEMYN